MPHINCFILHYTWVSNLFKLYKYNMIYTCSKQLVTSVHNFVHLNFVLCLLLAYVVFAAGIETATGIKVRTMITCIVFIADL